MQIGVECGYDEGLTLVDKKLTVQELHMALKKLSAIGLTRIASLSFIIGFPWETKHEISRTLQLIKNITSTYGIVCNINWLLFLPSNLWKLREKYKINVEANIYDNLLWFSDLSVFKQVHPLINEKLFFEVEEMIFSLQKLGLNVSYNRPLSINPLDALRIREKMRGL